MNTWFKALVFPLFLASSLAQAAENGGVTIGGTRVIYHEAKKVASLSITNSDTNPYLIQSWVENQNSDAKKSPFIVTPPLFRLEGNQQNLLRIVYIGANQPQDRESLFWLNVKSIPASNKKEGANTLQIAIKTRIKLIYRPQGVRGVPEEMADKLTWSRRGNQLTVNNPTPFYMNFHQVKVGEYDVKKVTFVAPMSSATFVAPESAVGSVTWKIITDYGGVSNEYSAMR